MIEKIVHNQLEPPFLFTLRFSFKHLPGTGKPLGSCCQ